MGEENKIANCVSQVSALQLWNRSYWVIYEVYEAKKQT